MRTEGVLLLAVVIVACKSEGSSAERDDPTAEQPAGGEPSAGAAPVDDAAAAPAEDDAAAAAEVLLRGEGDVHGDGESERLALYTDGRLVAGEAEGEAELTGGDPYFMEKQPLSGGR